MPVFEHTELSHSRFSIAFLFFAEASCLPCMDAYGDTRFCLYFLFLRTQPPKRRSPRPNQVEIRSALKCDRIREHYGSQRARLCSGYTLPKCFFDSVDVQMVAFKNGLVNVTAATPHAFNFVHCTTPWRANVCVAVPPMTPVTGRGPEGRGQRWKHGQRGARA
jgi:hypothetical protein